MTTFTAIDGTRCTPITRAELIKHPAFANLATDTDGNPIVWENSYECIDCGEVWDDQWSCGCDDDCPKCGAAIAAYRMDWLPAGKGEPGEPVYDLWASLPEAMAPYGEVTAPPDLPRPMWLCAWVTNYGENDLRDSFTLHRDEDDARRAYNDLIATHDRLHCAAIAPIKEATEPHWMGAS